MIRTPPTSRRLLPSAFLPLLLGCVSVGPASIQAQRPSYTEVIAATDKEELLTNIVRLRYLDTPVFLRVGSVTATPSLGMRVGANVDLDEDLDLAGAGVQPSVSYQDAPTIVYKPLEGRDFANELLLPIGPGPVFLMVSNGFDLKIVARLLFRSMNGLSNDRADTAEERSAFREVVAQLSTLMADGLVRLGTPEGGLDPGDPRLLLRVDPRVHDREAARAAFETLGLAPGLETIEVRFGLVHDEASIAVETRSLLSVLAYISNDVEVAPEDEAVVWPAEGDPVSPLMRVRTSDERPAFADPAIRLRGRWFYLAADDLRSRNTFYLLRLLFSLQAQVAGGGDGVVLTLPVR